MFWHRLWHRLTGSMLVALAGLCGYFGFERMHDFAAGDASALRDLGFAAAWWLLFAASLIAAFFDFRRGHARVKAAE